MLSEHPTGQLELLPLVGAQVAAPHQALLLALGLAALVGLEDQLVVAPQDAGALADVLGRRVAVAPTTHAVVVDVRVGHGAQVGVVAVAVRPDREHPAHVAALALVGRPMKEEPEHRLGPIARGRVAADQHGVRDGDGREEIPRHVALVGLADQVIHVEDPLDVGDPVVVEQLVGPAALLDQHEFRGRHQRLDGLAPVLVAAHVVDLGRRRIAADHVDVELAAGLPTIDRLGLDADAPGALAHADVDRVGQAEAVAVGLALAVAEDRLGRGGLGRAGGRRLVEATREVAVGDRFAVADQLTGAALGVLRVHPVDVLAAGRAEAGDQTCEGDHARKAGKARHAERAGVSKRFLTVHWSDSCANATRTGRLRKLDSRGASS